MEESQPDRGFGAGKTGIPGGHDYEYDEAHDVPAGPLAEPHAPRRVDAPHLNLDQGGDYGYDEAHDFGTP